MKKLIKITESQYKRIFLSEQDNKDSFCGKSYGGKYNDKGSYVIESKDGKTYKFAKKYSVEQKDYKYGLIIDGNSKTKFYYKCDGDVFFIEGGEKEKLSEKLNKISNNEAAADNPCLEKGKRLYRVNEKVVKGVFNSNDITTKKLSKNGCSLFTNSSNRGVNYRVGFIEKPNYYKIDISGDNFIIGKDTYLYNFIQNSGDESYKRLLDNKFKKFIIMGDYSLNKTGVVGLYNFSIEKATNTEGKEFSFKKDVEISDDSNPAIFKQIVESFEHSDYAQNPGKFEKEEIKKSAGDKYEKSATKIKDLLDGFTNDYDFIDIYKEIYKYNCKELKILNKSFELISGGKSLRKAFNSQTTQPGWKDYINDMSDYLNVNGCTEERRKKLKSNIDKMVKEEGHVEKELRGGGGFRPSDKTSGTVYTRLKSNPTPKYIADTIKNSYGGVFGNDNEAWAQAAFESIRNKSTYDKVSKSLGKDPYKFVKDFISTNKEYHTKGKTIDKEYKRITGNNPY